MINCFRFSKLNINILSLFICLICFILFISTAFISKNIFSNLIVSNNETSNSSENSNTDESSSNENEEINEEIEIEYDWALKIPKINLYAEIAEGTDDEILNLYIGHFKESKKESGNVCLAAHNRGYDFNYFANLKELEEGDEILYFINGYEYKYIVDEILVIYETDWTVIENTEEDRITLITCIENREKYRLCVRGIMQDS